MTKANLLICKIRKILGSENKELVDWSFHFLLVFKKKNYIHYCFTFFSERLYDNISFIKETIKESNKNK